MRRRLWVAGAVLVALVLAVGGFVWWRGGDRTSFSWAVERAPSGTQRLSWTDWAAVRRHEGADLSAGSSVADLHRFLGRAFDDDLSSTSALVASAPVLQQRFGFSPANADWELFSQSYQGAVVMLHLPSHDLGAVAGHLRGLGYREPSDPGGVWQGGPDLVTGIDASLTPELSYVAVDPDDSVVLTSDSRRSSPWPSRPSTATGHASRASARSSTTRESRSRRRSTRATTPAGRWRWLMRARPTRQRPDGCSRRPAR